MISKDVISISGARTNNLKNIDLDIPKNQLVVITGLSGSGKSSLAIDTLFAEGQRQYIESLSLYARQFFEQNAATDVDAIIGLQPTICINQRRGAPNPRSTVATMTEIYDFLRLLFAKLGTIRCLACDQIVAPQTVQQICEQICQLPEKSKVMILAPLVSQRKGAHRDVLERVRKERLVRVRIDSQTYDIDRLPEIDPKTNHSIDAVADRVIVKAGIENRLFESLELAANLANGAITISYLVPGGDDWSELFFSTQNSCPSCGESCPPITTRSFSFNSAYGACQTCSGLGAKISFAPERIIPDPALTIPAAIKPWHDLGKKSLQKRMADLQGVVDKCGISHQAAVSDWSVQQRSEFLHSQSKGALGLLVLLEQEYTTSSDEARLDELESYRGSMVCHDCQGTRLGRAGNSVFIEEKSIAEICEMSLSQFKIWLDSLTFDDNGSAVAQPILEQLKNRTRFLNQVGLEYLALNRSSESLSGGELQRVRLAKSIGNGLTGVCYVLDEPSVGLHASDNRRLIETMAELSNRNNTVVVVEHDEEIMRAADQLIEIGPGAGINGGQLLFQGDPETICQQDRHGESLTGQYLSGKKQIGERRNRIQCRNNQQIVLTGARGFNLKNVDLRIPQSAFTCVSGVSGSGKSTLIYQTLAPAIKMQLGLVTQPPAPFDTLTGIEDIQSFVEIDQRPISRTPRGCAATYTGVFDDIRKIYAATKMAKQLGLTASRFSFNTKSGWCSQCEGHGTKRISMKFMPDVFVQCSSCQGKRFNEKTLSVEFAGMSIADVLEMPIEQSRDAFVNFSRIHEKLDSLCQLGLGYLTLGQPSTSLSGGEAQRIKLATALSSRRQGNAVYLMDEPTNGLHFHDTQMLIGVISQLVTSGNTFIVIEHDLDVIACADWVIDLGPGAGQAGGHIVAEGTPEMLAKNADSLTGKCIADRSGNRKQKGASGH